jgi:hypothetical protein
MELLKNGSIGMPFTPKFFPSQNHHLHDSCRIHDITAFECFEKSRHPRPRLTPTKKAAHQGAAFIFNFSKTRLTS